MLAPGFFWHQGFADTRAPRRVDAPDLVTCKGFPPLSHRYEPRQDRRETYGGLGQHLC